MSKYRPLRRLLFVALVFGGTTPLRATESAHWLAFKDAKDRAPSGILSDFSYAGYEHGEKAIPDVAGPLFSVTDYGAVPDDGISDEEAIRKAIAAAEEAGGGVVMFPRGKFLVWTDRHKQEPIRITRSGVVLRGAGCGRGGTVIRIVHSGYGVGPYPVKGVDFATIPFCFVFGGGEKTDESAAVPVDGAIARGSFLIPVKSTDGFRSGDWVVLKATTHKLDAELLAGLQPDPTWTRILETGASINELHQIVEVREGGLVLKEPVLVNLGEDFGVRVSRVSPIERVGMEDVALQGGWRQVFVHHRSALDDEGWDGIVFKGVVNGWVRRCAFLNMNTGVYLRESAACSILQNRFAGNKGHYDVAIRSNSSFNMTGLTEQQAGHHHGASTGNRSAGTVVWRWQIPRTQSIDSHGNGSYATLIDKVDGGTMTYSGGPAPAFPNHLRWMVFWNFSYDADDKQPVNFWNYVKGKEAKFVKPLFAGLHGKPLELKADALEDNESPGIPVEPESLYEAQLALRAGKTPAWVDEAKTEWEALRAGELPPFAAADIAADDIHREEFELGDLLGDWTALMANEEQGWGVPIEYPREIPAVRLHNDYVLLRTILQSMATYASPLPAKGGEKSVQEGKPPYAVLPPLKTDVVVSGKELTISMPIQSDAKAQSKNAAALTVARELAGAIGATLQVEPAGLKLAIPI